MNVDLSNAGRDIRALLKDAVEIYLHSMSRSPAEHPRVRRVELAFLVGGPTLYVDLDTRQDAQPDGDATHRCVAQSQHPEWKAFLSPSDKRIRFEWPDGTDREFESDDVDQEFASFLVAELRYANDAGVFDRIADPQGATMTVTYEGCLV